MHGSGKEVMKSGGKEKSEAVEERRVSRRKARGGVMNVMEKSEAEVE